MINLRPLRADDVPNLPQIRPTYITDSILKVEKSGAGIEASWRLVEHKLPEPFDKRTLYDFDDTAQAEIHARLERQEGVYQWVAEDPGAGRLVGLLEVEIQDWNNTAVLANLMIDVDYRRQGLGRRLWRRALDFARDAEVRAIMIETQNTNIAACRFYVEMGCQLVGINEAFYTNDGQNSEIAVFWAYLFSGFS